MKSRTRNKETKNNISDVDELLKNLKEMRNNESDPHEILQQLIAIQNRVKYCNFQNYSYDKLISIFGDFWLFLLYTSAQTSNKSVIISTIRTAAIFLFNLGPFFPQELQESFSTTTTVSTIDMATSSLIASVFGFISYHISIPYRQKFLSSCPIFHHITQSQNCQDYFISSLSHYSHLGSEWHRILLKSFISKIIENRHDKLYWRAIVKIVSDDPSDLFVDVFNTIIQNKIYEYHIQFMSSYLTITNAPLNELGLFEIAKYCLTILTNNKILDETERPLTCNEKSSIFTILALKSNSFSIQITTKSDSVLTFVLTNISNTEKMEKELTICDLNESPEFYLLDLPVELVFPKGDEGSTLLAAKMTLLVKYLNSDDHDLIEKIFNIIQSMSSKPYDTTVSACFQGISNSLFYIQNKDTVENLLRILYPSIFCDSTSWFHDLDRLKVLKAMPLEAIVAVTGKKMLFSVFDTILSWAKEKNEKLAKDAQEVIVHSFMAQSDREILIQRVIDKCDIFDGHDLIRTLQIMNLYLHSNKRTPPLISFCKTIIQLLTVYPDDPDIYTEICRFMSYFKIRKLKPHTLNICIAVIIATYQMITGNKPTVPGLSESLISDEYDMIENVTMKQPFDIINENLNEYKSFVPFLYETMHFLLSVQKFDYTFLEPIITYSIKFFPFEATSLLYKHWNNINSDIKVSILIRNSGVIGITSNFQTAGMWFEMYMDISSKEISNPSLVAPLPYMHIGNSHKNMISLETVKLTFKSIFESLKYYLNMSLPYYNNIDDNSLLFFLHFQKFVDPMKPFDFDRISEPKRSRVIALINDAPSNLKQQKNRKYTSYTSLELGNQTEQSNATIKDPSSTDDLISFDNVPLRETESVIIPSQKKSTDDNESPSVSSSATIVNSNQGDEDAETFRDDFHVSINFEYEKPKITTMDQLKEKMSFKDPLVEIQLKYDLYNFTSEELTSIYDYFSHLNDYQSVLNAIDDYSKRNNSEFTKNSNNEMKLINVDEIVKKEKIKKKEILDICKYLNNNDHFTPDQQQLNENRQSNLNMIDSRSSSVNFFEIPTTKANLNEPNESNLIDLSPISSNLIDFTPIDTNSNEFKPNSNEIKPKNLNLIKSKSSSKLIDLKSGNSSQLRSSNTNFLRSKSSNFIQIDEDSDEISQLMKFILLMITQTDKKKKLRYLLIALGNLIWIKGTLRHNDFKSLIATFNESYSKLPKYELSVCLLPLCQRMGKRNRLQSLLTRLDQDLSSVESQSLIIAGSYAHLYQPKDVSLLAKKLIIDNNDNLLTSIRTGIRMLTIVADQQIQPTLDLFPQLIPSIINIGNKCGRCEMIHSEVSHLFKVLFNDKTLSKLDKRQTLHFSKLSTLKLPTNAIFSSYASSIPNLVNLFLSFEPYSDIPSSYHSNRCVFYIDTYFDLIKIEYKEASNKKEMIVDKLTQFATELNKNKIQIAIFYQYVYRWIMFLSQDYQFPNIINMMLPLSSPHFEFFFTGVMLYIKDHKNDISENDKKLITKWKTKARSKAFQYALTFDKELITAGIELSRFNEDCDESNEIINKFKLKYAEIKK